MLQHQHVQCIGVKQARRLCLTASNAIVPMQEMASRGVSLVYRLGGPEARKKLVEALVGVLQGTSATGGARAVKVTGDTKVFEYGAIGSAPGEQCLWHVMRTWCNLAVGCALYWLIQLLHVNLHEHAGGWFDKLTACARS